MVRFITAAKSAEVDRKQVVTFSPTHFQSFHLVTQETTDWYVVPDDDPRVRQHDLAPEPKAAE